MVTSSFTENSRKTQMTFTAVSGGWGVGGGSYMERNWVWSKGEIHPFNGRGERFMTKSKYELFWTTNPLRHPGLSIP